MLRRQITYTYDQLNRLLQKLYPDSTAVNYTSHYPLQGSARKKRRLPPYAELVVSEANP